MTKIFKNFLKVYTVILNIEYNLQLRIVPSKQHMLLNFIQCTNMKN